MDGFLFAPGDYSGEYEAIGLVMFSVWPDAVYRFEEWTEKGGVVKRGYRWTIGEVSGEEAIEAAHAQAVKLGADALTHFVIRPQTQNLPHGGIMEGIEICGYAIDRK